MNALREAASHDFPIGSNPALSAQVRQELIDSLAAGGGVSAEQAAQELDRRDLTAAFDARFADLSLSRTQLADVLAAHVLSMWSIVHDCAVPADRSDAAALREQLGASLAQRPEAADPGKRQLIGEALVCETMLSLEARDDARNRSDRNALVQMAETAQRNLLNRQAINLRKTRFTAQGMRRV